MFGFRYVQEDKDGNIVDYFVDYAANKARLTELALEIAVNKIADTISKLGFKIFTTDKRTKNEVDYIFNVKPNVNQNATDFWRQVVYRMIRKPEGCLVINLKERGLFIADNWQVDNKVISEKIYRDITIIVDDDTLKLNRSFKADDVMHFRYSNLRLMALLKEANELVEKAWMVTLNGCRAKAPKLKLSFAGGFQIQKADGTMITTNEYAKEVARQLSSDEITAIVSSSAIDISQIEAKNAMTPADLKTLKEEVYGNVAMAMGIPKDLLYGGVTSNTDVNNTYITYACEPIIKNMEDTINGAYIDREDYIEREKIIINTLRVKHIDVIDSAGNLDKLYSNGWSHNDIMELIGMPIIEEDWAYERRFTKNYSTDVEGGETDGRVTNEET